MNSCGCRNHTTKIQGESVALEEGVRSRKERRFNESERPLESGSSLIFRFRILASRPELIVGLYDEKQESAGVLHFINSALKNVYTYIYIYAVRRYL